jgi:pyroglutamyl-peptidase
MPRVIFREGQPNIRIILYPDAVRTSWFTVRKLIPRLWNGKKSFYRLYQNEDEPDQFKIHAILHIGMLDQPHEAFRLERNGFKCGYDLPDVDGKWPTEEDKTGGGTWTNVPESLSTDFHLDSLYKRVISELTVCVRNETTLIHDSELRNLRY